MRGAALAAILLAACASTREGGRAATDTNPIELARAWPVMGTLLEVRARAPDSAAARAALAGARAAVFAVDSLMSTYRPDSEISRLNAAAGTGAWSRLSPWTQAVLDASLKWARVTGGAFDPTVGPAVRAWGFHRGEGRIPPTRTIDSLRARVGWRAVAREGERARIERGGAALDFGAIAKGFALDRAAEAMRAAGSTGGIVDLGGQVAVYGLAPDGEPTWPIGIRHPRRPDATLGRIEIPGGSVATSGDTERFFVVDGVRYSHIIDPRTAWPVEGVAQVTVAAPAATVADALSTALFVMGPDEGRAFLERHAPEVTAVWVRDPDGGDVTRDDIVVSGPEAGRVRISLDARNPSVEGSSSQPPGHSAGSPPTGSGGPSER